MSRRLAIALLIAAGPLSASAQTAPVRRSTAAPSSHGRHWRRWKTRSWRPVRRHARAIGDVEGAAASGSPCPAAKPLDPAEARALVHDIAAREQFFPDFVVAVATIESRFNSVALSDKGAYGLMQLEPSTAQRYGVDLCDPAGNVLGGVRYLRYLHDRYKNPMFILSAYNAGEQRMLDARGIPPFPETIKFVADVLNAFYEWPSPETTTVAVSPRAGGRIPTPEPQAALAAARHETGAASWSQGFVKHIE